jgi:hypothetical protein
MGTPMNVGELKEALEDYGDHVIVFVTVDYGTSKERDLRVVGVDYGNYNGPDESGSGVELELEE